MSDGDNIYFADTASGTVDLLNGVTLSILAGGGNQTQCGGFEVGTASTWTRFLSCMGLRCFSRDACCCVLCRRADERVEAVSKTSR
jgi:hypothetical protein